MGKRSPVAIFLAASAVLAVNGVHAHNCDEGHMGGTKTWTTDEKVDAESTLDEDAKKIQKKAKKNDLCVPIGEGENCW